MSPFPFGTRVGILGDGQLARMLVEAAGRLGIQPIVFAKHADSPAGQICRDTVVGDLAQAQLLSEFLKRCEFVTFENEFIDTAHLEQVAGETRFFPTIPTIGRLRDKLGQKELLREKSIPSAEFRVYESGQDPLSWLEESLRKFGGRTVLKWGRMGYDGKGVFFLSNIASQKDQALKFCRHALDRDISLFAEASVRFRRELALIACRSSRGEFLAYPLVVSEQENGICLDVTGPASALGLASGQEENARRVAKTIAEASGMVGCFALEFFETENGDLWVNELAPRVHNSGHYTQDACGTSQFENHWRAVLGLPLGAPDAAPGFLMGNLLGPQGISCRADEVELPDPGPRLRLHWYGKSELLPGRKMGHVNARVSDPGQLPEAREEMHEYRRKWIAAAQQRKGKAKS